ncbi:MAG: efflux RND transporter periplasmic adaptor subunit [Myxococcota bacterium]
MSGDLFRRLGLCAALAVGPAAGACSRDDDVHGHGHEEQHADEFERGPHGGRLLEEGGLAFELAIHEGGSAPELRVYPYRDGKPLDPAGIEADVELRRAGGRIEKLTLAPRGDHLVGEREIAEPHSFDVVLDVRVEGAQHRFAFASYENRIEMSEAVRIASDIELATAGPAEIDTGLVLYGRIALNDDRTTRVFPRFPGVAKSVRKRLGDAVAANDVLAVIESNESLHPYEVRARSAGTVVAKALTEGEFASADREIFVIADLSTVWIDLQVERRDAAKIRVGQRVRVDPGNDAAALATEIHYVSPIGSASTQALLARALLPNPDGSLRPGLFASAEVFVEQAQVPVAVEVSALQTLQRWTVVFIRDGDVFQAQPVEVGRRDARNAEILSGLDPGTTYATRNSFVLKADVGKSGAAHDH